MIKVRDCVARMTAYVPGEAALDSGVVKLNQNENRYPMSSRALAAARKEASGLGLYPESSSAGVRNAAAELYGVRPEEVMATNGSDEILRLLFHAYCDPGDAVFAFYPSYTYYATLAAMYGADYRLVDFTADYRLPPGLKLPEAKLAFLPNPNAPTGTVFSGAEIRGLIEATPNGVVVIDEAYADFAPPGTSVIPLIGEYDNLAVVRTLSKSHALAGLRVGLGFMREAALAELDKVRDYYNLDRLAQAGGEAALRDTEWLRETTGKIVATRERVTGELRRLGLEVVPSGANFIMVGFGGAEKARRVFSGLKARKVLVRYFDKRRVDSFLRVTVGTDADMDRFLDALRGTLQEPA
ncbi:MAG: histidinol-phosphate transaminase [Planctomycetota bacterium]|jgi:histidinol-phosphate aminotransferase|nr:histidinol-phosphate transaminase [Planctomycetota bacterium]